jgi:hypothetical protein
MNRRHVLFSATTFVLLSTTAARADYVEDVVEWLTGQGYRNIEVTRTFLGRVKIVASKGNGRRELICNPRTGEILRDIWIDADGEIHPPTVTSDSSGSNSGGTTNSSDDDDEDDDRSRRSDDDDDDDDDDDHSGHGGGDDDDDDDSDKRGKD